VSNRNNETPDALLDRGLVEMALGNDEGAISLWKSALAVDSNNPRALDFLQSVGQLPMSDGPMDPISEFALGDAAAAESGDDLAEAPTGADGLPMVTGEAPAVPSGEFQTVEPPLSGGVPLPAPGTWASGRWESMNPDPEALFALAQNEFDRLDFESSLYHCEQVLVLEKDHHGAQTLAHRNRDYLMARYGEYIGDLDQIAVLAVDDESLDDLSYEPTQAYVLQNATGSLTVRQLISEAPGIDEFRMFRTFHFLIENGIITLRSL
jgi:tetratricopeptide (TPR) repeat protein